jgi:hypothetical protein
MAERFENVNSVAHRWKRPASLPSDLDFVLGSRLRAYLANCLTAVDRRNDSLPMDTMPEYRTGRLVLRLMPLT